MANQTSEDNLYIERFLNGEEEGFEMLVRKYQDRVLNIVYSLIGQDRESEDIAQEVFLKVYRSLRSFQERSRFSTWLYRIVVNTTYDFLRRRNRLKSRELAMEKIVARCPSPQDALSEREKEEMLRAALANVPLKYRTALVLKDINGLSYNEIAQVLHCRIGTVESRIYRGRQIIRQQLLRREGEAV